jgi:hypothetical protein
LPYKLGLNHDQKRGKDPMMKDDIGALECSALQARVKSRIAVKMVQDPMMKDSSGG